MTSTRKIVVVAVVSLFTGLLVPVGNAQQISGPVKAKQLTGLPGVKDNAKGTLGVENGRCIFSTRRQLGVTSIRSYFCNRVNVVGWPNVRSPFVGD